METRVSTFSMVNRSDWWTPFLDDVVHSSGGMHTECNCLGVLCILVCRSLSHMVNIVGRPT